MWRPADPVREFVVEGIRDVLASQSLYPLLTRWREDPSLSHRAHAMRPYVGQGWFETKNRGGKRSWDIRL